LIDFQRIRESVDIVAVAKWLGLEVHGGKSRCPFHQDRTPSLSFKDGRFKCFGCDASGDVVDLVAKMKDISTLEAVTQVTEALHLDECSPTPRKPMEFKEPHLQEYIDKTKEAFAITRQAQDYLESRGFNGESMLRFRFGFDAVRNAIVIPYGSESTYYTSRR